MPSIQLKCNLYVYLRIYYNSIEVIITIITMRQFMIQEGEARGRGQLSFDNPDVTMV